MGAKFHLAVGLLLLGFAAVFGYREPRPGHVLHYWNGFTGPDGRTMQRMVAAYEAQESVAHGSGPPPRVEMQLILWTTYYDKLMASLAAGNPPDVFVLPTTRLADFARTGRLMPMDDLFAPAGGPLRAEDFVEPALTAARYEGATLGVPLDIYPEGLYCNRELFIEAGLTDATGRPRYPRTSEEFFVAARRLTRDTDGDGETDQFGFGIAWQLHLWYTLLRQFDGRLYADDGRRVAFDDEAGRRALRLITGLVHERGVTTNPQNMDQWVGFWQGRIGMIHGGVYMLQACEEQEGLDFDVTPFPVLGDRPAVQAGSHLLCMPSGLPQPRRQRALDFIAHLSRQSLIWAAGGQLPARRDLLESEPFARLEHQPVFARQLPYLEFIPGHADMAEIETVFDDELMGAILGIISADEAIDRAATRIQAILDRGEPAA